ncbi:Long-chain-fatty-acid--CoA ligase [compost metagenome]
MIISSGFKVFPSEIERILNAHPGVLESAVVPAPDEKAGEVPIAYVVPRQPYLDKALVIAHCEKHLVSYKRPRRIIFRDELPKSNVGKILRKELVGIEQQEHSR